MLRRYLTSLAFGTLGLAGFFIVPSSFKLLFGAETFEGHLFGLAGLATFVGAGALILYVRLGGRRAALIAASNAAVVIVLAIILGARAQTPSAEAAIGAPYNLWFRDREPRGLAFSDLLPEIDQVALGFSVARVVDPLLDAKHAEHVRSVTLPIYREMLAAPEYRTLGSAMPFAYADVFYRGDNGAGHAFVYVPRHEKEEKLGALVFAHGSAGNFASYIHVWRALADAEKLVIVCPTFGFGDWGRNAGVELFRHVVEVVLGTLPVDRGRVFIAGLSQGGDGITRVAPDLAGKIRGVILISPVLNDAALRDARWRDLPVLVLHGSEDERIPLYYIEYGVKDLKNAGAKINLSLFDHEDHFLFFSQREWTLRELAAFIHQNSS